MIEIAALGIKASTSGVAESADDLKKLTGAATDAEKATEKLGPAAKKAGIVRGNRVHGVLPLDGLRKSPCAATNNYNQLSVVNYG